MKRGFRKITTGVVVLLSMSAAVARADVVLDWNAIMMNTISGQNPFAQARFAAITEAAVFEAVNAITGDYEPYLGTITAPPGASAEAAAVAAAHGVLKHYFPAAVSLDAGSCQFARGDPERSGQRRRDRRRRGCGGGDDRRARQRRLGAATVLRAALGQST